MLHATMLCEDTTLIATYRNDPPTGREDGTTEHNGMWHVIVQDNLSGETQEAKWTNEQFSAVVWLMYGNDDASETAKGMYAIAEPLFEKWPNNVRCIP